MKKYILAIVLIFCGLITQAQQNSFKWRFDKEWTVSGTDTYTATIADFVLVKDVVVKFKFTNANTGASTLQINGGSVIAIKKNGTTALGAGDIGAGATIQGNYDGTNWQIQGGGSGTSYTFTNGLTESGGTVKLGSSLTEATTITGSDANTLTFNTMPITLAKGTIVDGVIPYNFTGTLPSSASATNALALFSITTAGSSAFSQQGVRIFLNAGYTGNTGTSALFASNAVAGTNTTAPTTVGVVGNRAMGGVSSVTTIGYNYGVQGGAALGDRNVGVIGLARVDKNSATNIGVVGVADNNGSSPIYVGGYFGLNAESTFPTTSSSAALIADNAAKSANIFVARDNGNAVFTIANDGVTTITTSGDNTALTSTGSGDGHGVYGLHAAEGYAGKFEGIHVLHLVGVADDGTFVGRLLKAESGDHVTMNSETNEVDFDLSSTVQFNTGTLPIQRAFTIKSPTYAFVGASTMTDGILLDIDGAPNGGTNATITNSYALRIPTKVLTNVTNGFAAQFVAPSGATNNYALSVQGNMIIDALTVSNKGINTTAGDGATIDSHTGRFRKDTSGSSFTLTNSYITTNSIVVLTLVTTGITAGYQLSVQAGSGTATITFETAGVGAAPNANCDVNFWVIN